jgi:uncharacterized membrane protein YgcG
MDDTIKKAVAILVALSMIVPALAQADLPDPGILPTSPIYGIKRGWERALDVITFDPESKSRLHYTYALTRLSEANALSDLNETEQIPEIIEDYGEEMNITEELSNQTSDDANQTDANNTRGIGSLVSAFMKDSNMTWEKHLFVLGLVAQKVPPQAAARIERNINRTLERRYSNETLREEVREKVRGKDKSTLTDDSGEGNKPEDAGAGQGQGQNGKPDTGKPSDDSQKGNGNKDSPAGGNNGGNKGGSSSGGGDRGKG